MATSSMPIYRRSDGPMTRRLQDRVKLGRRGGPMAQYGAYDTAAPVAASVPDPRFQDPALPAPRQRSSPALIEGIARPNQMPDVRVIDIARPGRRVGPVVTPEVTLPNPIATAPVVTGKNMANYNPGPGRVVGQRPVAVDGFGDPRVPGAPLKGAPAMDPLRPFGNMAPITTGGNPFAEKPALGLQRDVLNGRDVTGANMPSYRTGGSRVRGQRPGVAPMSADDVARGSAIRNETRGIDNLSRMVRGDMAVEPNQEYESSVAKTAALRAQAAELLQGRGRGGNADLYDSSNPSNMGNATGPRLPAVNGDFQASMNRKEGRVGMSTNRQRAAQMPGGMPDLPAGFQYADQRERASQPRAAANMYMGSKPYDPVPSENIGDSVPSDIRASLEAGQPLNRGQRARLRAVGAERRERLRSNTAFQDYRDRLRERREDALDLRREANALRGGQQQTGALTYVDRGTGLTGTQRTFSGPSMSLAEAAGRVRQRREDQRRQDEADEMAQGQQRFNQRLQVVEAMPDGPAKDAALRDLNVMAGAEPLQQDESEARIQSVIDSGQLSPLPPPAELGELSGMSDDNRRMIANYLRDVLNNSTLSRDEKITLIERAKIYSRQDIEDLQNNLDGFDTSGFGEYALTPLYDDLFGDESADSLATASPPAPSRETNPFVIPAPQYDPLSPQQGRLMTPQQRRRATRLRSQPKDPLRDVDSLNLGTGGVGNQRGRNR